MESTEDAKNGVWQKTVDFAMLIGGLVILFLIGDVIMIIAHRLTSGQWNYISIHDAFSRFGLSVNGKVGNFSIVAAIAIAAIGVLTIADDIKNPSPPQPYGIEVKSVKSQRFFGAWFWPTQIREETTALIRAGRVVHWLAVAIVMIMIMLAMAILFSSETGTALGVAMIAAPTFLIGRAIRYILAAE